MSKCIKNKKMHLKYCANSCILNLVKRFREKTIIGKQFKLR